MFTVHAKPVRVVFYAKPSALHSTLGGGTWLSNTHA